MNLIDLLKLEFQLWIVIGIPFCILATAAVTMWERAQDKKKRIHHPKGPHIALDAPCPACGNIGCILNYDMIAKMVQRKCGHCGCVVRQPPVAPRLFADPQAK